MGWALEMGVKDIAINAGSSAAVPEAEGLRRNDTACPGLAARKARPAASGEEERVRKKSLAKKPDKKFSERKLSQILSFIRIFR
jgi:hypothetical protein